jgi:hypothetical protein
VIKAAVQKLYWLAVAGRNDDPEFTQKGRPIEFAEIMQDSLCVEPLWTFIIA